MQHLVAGSEPLGTSQIPDKRRSDSLQLDQGPSKRVCTRQAGAVAHPGGSDQQALQQLRQQQEGLSSCSHHDIHSSHAQQHPPQQQQHARDSLSPATAESAQDTQQLTWQSQQGDSDAVVSVQVVSYRGAADQVSHRTLTAKGCCVAINASCHAASALAVYPRSCAMTDAGACACRDWLCMMNL